MDFYTDTETFAGIVNVRRCKPRNHPIANEAEHTESVCQAIPAVIMSGTIGALLE